MSLFISYNREQKDFADKIESSVRTVCPILRDTNDIAPWGEDVPIAVEIEVAVPYPVMG